MRLLIALIGTLALTGGPLTAQPLNFDPFYVLPAGPGQTGVDAGFSAGEGSDTFNTSDVVAMAKFNPHEKIEAGARFAFGWFNDAASNFSSLVVGAKYSLGATRAATANLAVPAGDVDNPGLSIGLMQTIGLASKVEVNTQLQLGLLKGYTGGQGLIVDALVEPSFIFSDRLSGYLAVTVNSNTDGFSDFLAIDLKPNVDLGISDGSVLNIALAFGLSGDAKRSTTGFNVIFLRAM